MSKYKRLTQKSNNGVWGIDGKLVNQRQNGDKVFTEAFDIIINRIAELEDKIENGTLIELPCKVGDTVYVIYQYSDFLGKEDEPFIEEDIAQFFVYDENKMKIVPSRYGERSEYWYKALDILPTREEAEKRLKELKNEYKSKM